MESWQARFQAVSTLNVGKEILVLCWHGSVINLPVIDLPDVCHVHHAGPAHRAGVVAIAHHLIKACLVDQMVAGWDLRWYPWGVYVLHAHWAVGAGHSLHTLVCSLQTVVVCHDNQDDDIFYLQMIGQTHVTAVAVEIVTATSNLTQRISMTVNGKWKSASTKSQSKQDVFNVNNVCIEIVCSFESWDVMGLFVAD